MVKGIIVADGAGERPTSGSWAPQCAALAPIVNRSLLERAIETLGALGATEIAIAADGHTVPRLRSAIEGRAGQNIRWLPVEPGESARSALVHAADRLGGERFIVHSGSGLWLSDPGVLASALTSSDAGALMLMRPVADVVALSGVRPRPLARTTATAGATEPLGVHALGAEVLERLATGIQDLPLADAIAVAADGDCARALVGEGWWDYRGDADSLLDANRRVLENIASDEGSVGESVFIEGRVHIDPTADVRSSMIRGPVVIGAHATVHDAYIGPYTTIGETATIENSEIECSMVLTGARIRNVAVRIERSIIGQGALIGRRFELPRTLRLLVGEDARISLG